MRIVYILSLTFVLLFTSCKDFDSTKIIEPTTYQIEAVSLSMPREMIPTNVAAQKVEDHEQYTLVGATFRWGSDEIVGIWLFDEENPQDIFSINEIAQNYSPFPRKRDELQLTNETRNLSAFLMR